MGGFYHEKLVVYQRALECVDLADELAAGLPGRWLGLAEQLRRAALSIPANIAEGAAETCTANRKRFFRIARGSAAEAASYAVVMRRRQLHTPARIAPLEDALSHVSAMLTSLLTHPRPP